MSYSCLISKSNFTHYKRGKKNYAKKNTKMVSENLPNSTSKLTSTHVETLTTKIQKPRKMKQIVWIDCKFERVPEEVLKPKSLQFIDYSSSQMIQIFRKDETIKTSSKKLPKSTIMVSSRTLEQSTYTFIPNQNVSTLTIQNNENCRPTPQSFVKNNTSRLPSIQADPRMSLQFILNCE